MPPADVLPRRYPVACRVIVFVVTTRITAGMPTGLADALKERDAHVVQSWSWAFRHYAYAEAPGAQLFARHTTDPQDEANLAHEAAVRASIGSDGALRVPRILAAGSNWSLEQAIAKSPFAGPVCIDRALDAAAVLAHVTLPEPPRRRRPLDTARRRLRTITSPLPLADIRAARRIRIDPELPLVTTHGDFHRANLLVDENALWVIDWELSGRGPAGRDLLHLWCSLDDEEDRARLFRGIVELVGQRHEHALLKLRYSAMVATIATLLTAHHRFDRDRSRAERLLLDLPTLRAEARVAL